MPDSPEEDQPSVLESIRGGLEDRAPYGRNPEGTCGECGTSEGSTIELDNVDRELCRECFNDPDVLGDSQ